MIALLKKCPRWFALCLLVGLAMRLLMVLRFPPEPVGDAVVYMDIAGHMLRDHAYAISDNHSFHLTVIRMPGFPAYLAAVFAVFGLDNLFALRMVQVVIDLATCLLMTDLARRIAGERAARWTCLLAVSFPFIANYAATAHTEVMAVFLTTLALHQAAIGITGGSRWHWAASGAAIGAAIFVRPDSGLILITFTLVLAWLFLRDRQQRRQWFFSALVMGAVALTPLVPWTIRNWQVFHIIQPLVDPGALEPGEVSTDGFGNWTQSWLWDYSSVEKINFNLETEALDINDVPARAFDSAAERDYVAWLFAQHNQNLHLTRDLDDRFEQLYREKLQRHPLRVRLLLPAARTLNMWVRPRTEMLPLDSEWWKFKEDPHDSLIAMALGLINIAYVVLALCGTWWIGRHVGWGIRREVTSAADARALPAAGAGASQIFLLLWAYTVVRTIFFGRTGTTEPRYMLECFAHVFVAGGVMLAVWTARRASSVAQPPHAG